MGYPRALSGYPGQLCADIFKALVRIQKLKYPAHGLGLLFGSRQSPFVCLKLIGRSPFVLQERGTVIYPVIYLPQKIQASEEDIFIHHGSDVKNSILSVGVIVDRADDKAQHRFLARLDGNGRYLHIGKFRILYDLLLQPGLHHPFIEILYLILVQKLRHPVGLPHIPSGNIGDLPSLSVNGKQKQTGNVRKVILVSLQQIPIQYHRTVFRRF